MRFLLDRLLKMRLGGIFGFLAVAATAGVFAFFWMAHTVNTTPAQCATCHPELTDLWEQSRGHPADRVSCHECHAQHPTLPDSPNVLAYVRDTLVPEKYQSSVERVEARCLGCHEPIPLAETEQKKLVKINHKIHLASLVPAEGAAPVLLGCLDCHDTIAHDQGERMTNRPRMAGCFAGSCHTQDRTKDGCMKCHYQALMEPEQMASR
jgi:hypothetical protein